MPELPEVETVRRGLAPVMEGGVLEEVEQRRANLRFAFPEGFKARLKGKRLVRLGRRAKYLIMELDSGEALICHLGMSGSFRIETENRTGTPGVFHHPRGKAGAHDHVVFHVKGPAGNVHIIYNDPRRFGYMDIIALDQLDRHPWFAALGAEPIGNAMSAPYLAEKFAGRKTPLKSALLDQSNIAGLGNIYVCEALFRAKLSPKLPAGQLVTKAGTARVSLERLVPAIRDVISEAIDAGGSSLRDHIQTDGTMGYFQHVFRVYDREGEACTRPGCGDTVRRIVQSGRSTFYCPRCQKD